MTFYLTILDRQISKEGDRPNIVHSFSTMGEVIDTLERLDPRVFVSLTKRKPRKPRKSSPPKWYNNYDSPLPW